MHSEPFDTQQVIITGATSLVGHFLLPQLKSAGHTIYPFSRSKQSSAEINWHQFDKSLLSANPAVQEANTLIHLAPLDFLPEIIDEFVLMDGKRIITFSSTSRFSKLKSGSLSERKFAQKLITAEEIVFSRAQQAGVDLTIFRPTLIYGAGLDKNISSITRFIKRFGFFPIVGDGSGLRQPVHADDLAAACVMVLDNEKTFNQAYDLIGGETLSYKEMVERIFIALNKKPRFLSVPLSVFRKAMMCASILPAYSHITPDMADRMNHPLCFDSQKAISDFGYKNRGFMPMQEDLDPRLSYARL